MGTYLDHLTVTDPTGGLIPYKALYANGTVTITYPEPIYSVTVTYSWGPNNFEKICDDTWNNL